MSSTSPEVVHRSSGLVALDLEPSAIASSRIDTVQGRIKNGLVVQTLIFEPGKNIEMLTVFTTDRTTNLMVRAHPWRRLKQTGCFRWHGLIGLFDHLFGSPRMREILLVDLL